MLSRSLCQRYSLSWAMKPFALEAHRLWNEHITSFLSCQKQFFTGWSALLSPLVSVTLCIYWIMFSGFQWLAVKLCDFPAAFTALSTAPHASFIFPFPISSCHFVYCFTLCLFFFCFLLFFICNLFLFFILFPFKDLSQSLYASLISFHDES